jgi:hypothetical protein
MLAEIRANQANHEKAEALRNEMRSSEEEVKDVMETGLEKREAIPKEVEALAERQEVPRGATREETIGATEDGRRDRRLAIKRRGRLIRRSQTTEGREETREGPGMQQRHKEHRPTCRKREGIL